MPLKSLLGWTALALLGLALAAGVTLAASELSSQKIGLQSEPLDAGRDLAPPNGGEEGRAPQQPPTTTTTESDRTGDGDDATSGGSSTGSEPSTEPKPGRHEPDSDD